MDRRYIAHFQGEAWQNDYANPADDEGPDTWDCTEFVNQPRLVAYFAPLADLGEFDEFKDRDDVLKDDPAAPQWVRDWRGPFTITVTLAGGLTPGRGGIPDAGPCLKHLAASEARRVELAQAVAEAESLPLVGEQWFQFTRINNRKTGSTLHWGGPARHNTYAAHSGITMGMKAAVTGGQNYTLVSKGPDLVHYTQPPSDHYCEVFFQRVTLRVGAGLPVPVFPGP